MTDVFSFIQELTNRKISFTMGSCRDDSIMITVVVPGERWECEFFKNGEIEIEKFKNDGDILGEEAIQYLFDNYSE